MKEIFDDDGRYFMGCILRSEWFGVYNGKERFGFHSAAVEFGIYPCRVDTKKRMFGFITFTGGGGILFGQYTLGGCFITK